MFKTSVPFISKSYYISNEKIYPTNNNCFTISNVEKFNAAKFAEWMKKGFEKSPLKTITAMAEAVGSNKATISRLMSGAAQTLTNKPSQPNKELVKRLAMHFNEDLNEALLLAGYAPSNSMDSYNILEGVTIQFNQSVNLSKKEKEKILNAVKLIAIGVKAEQEHELSQKDKD